MFIDYFRVIFTNSSLINMLFLALAVISMILAVILYNLGKKIRLPTYAVRNLNLIKERKVGMNGLRISYQKQYIKNLSVAKIALWNSGKEAIRKEDIAEKEPIQILAINSNDILEAKIIYQKNEANNFSLTLRQQAKKILIDFDYFDKDEGIIVQIFHTGKLSRDLAIQGIIKTAGTVLRLR